METTGTDTHQSLWHDRAFLKLWAGQTISQVGSQISFLTLPLIAALTLNATAFEMGVLAAIGSLPALIVGFYAGVMVDRRKRRPVLVTTDIARALLLAIIPLAWVGGELTIELLVVIAFALGLCGLFFDLAYQAFLPHVVHREQLVEGNAKLELSRTVAEIAGPGFAGVLLHLVTAPLLVLLDAASYLGSGLLIASIRSSETANRQPSHKQGVWQDIREGLGLVTSRGVLRSSVGCTILLGFFNAALEAVFVLYVVRVLHIGPALLGIIFGVGSIGFLIGTALPVRMSHRVGFGTTTAVGVALVALSDLMVPLAAGSPWLVVPLLMMAQFVFGIGITIFRVNQSSLRQSVVADAFRGRVASVIHVGVGGAILLGALVGGVLGEVVGLRMTVAIAAAGELLVAVWIFYSPLKDVRQLAIRSV